MIADGRHSVPTQITLTVDGKSRVVSLPAIADQSAENASTPVHVSFPPMTGKTIRVTIDAVREERSKEYGSLKTTLEPVGIAEFGVPGLRLPPAPTTVDSGCRTDLLAIDGRPVPVRMTGAAKGADQVMALTVTPCGSSQLVLDAGTHHLTTALGRNVGWSIDRLVLASPDDQPLAVHDGRVTQLGTPAPAGPTITVTHNGATTVRAHVTGATAPFWLVLGESQSPGWQAHVVGGPDLGGSHLVDGYANGWLVKPTSRVVRRRVRVDSATPGLVRDSGSRCSPRSCASSIIAFTWRRAVPRAHRSDGACG